MDKVTDRRLDEENKLRKENEYLMERMLTGFWRFNPGYLFLDWRNVLLIFIQG